MTYLSIILFVFLSNFLSSRAFAETDSLSVFQDESYLELDPQFVDIRNISTAFNPVNDHVYAFDLNSDGVLWEFKPDGSISALDSLNFPEINKMMPIDITHSGESLWLWEQGLGKVFEYSFADSALRQIDRTRVQELMYGHGSVITKDERMLAIGGYGLWEFRNFLLEFTPGNGEWNKIETGGESLVTPFTYNYLGESEQKNRLYYIFVPLSAVEQRSDTRDVRTFEPFFEIYTLDLESNLWTHRNSVHPRETDLAFLKRPRSRATHSMDESRGTFVFSGRLTMNTETYELSYISHPSVEDMWSANFYYSKNSDRWVVIGRDFNISKQHLVVRSFPAPEAQFTPLEEEKAAYAAWLGWIFGGFTLLALVYIGLSRWKAGNLEEDISDTKKITLKEIDGSLLVSVGEDNIDLSDSSLNAFFHAVHDMKKKGQPEILMSEFDNRIFTDQHSQPFRSKIKKKIFKLVNSHFDRQKPFITTEPYPLDKRYKMIVLDLDRVTIHSS
jgi:hypothetical protein